MGIKIHGMPCEKFFILSKKSTKDKKTSISPQNIHRLRTNFTWSRKATKTSIRCEIFSF
jgi:hypothetical protein